MWIRMISTAAGPRLPHALLSEKIYEVDDELGAELIAARAAEKAADPAPKKAEAAVELAAVDDGEKALADGADKKPETLIDKLKKPSAKADAAKK